MLWAGNRRLVVLFWQKQDFCIRSMPVNTAAHLASYTRGTAEGGGGSSPRVRRPWRETDHSPPHNAESKNEWRKAPLSQGPVHLDYKRTHFKQYRREQLFGRLFGSNKCQGGSVQFRSTSISLFSCNVDRNTILLTEAFLHPSYQTHISFQR
jgi:hypothetical protein